MLNKIKLLLAVGLCIAAFSANASQAKHFVPADKLPALIMGKTIHAEHLKKGFKFSIYFDKDGKTAHRKQDGDVKQTTYRIDGDKHCILWKGKDRCARINDNNDGTYSRVNKKGKKVVKWNKIEDGNKL